MQQCNFDKVTLLKLFDKFDKATLVKKQHSVDRFDKDALRGQFTVDKFVSLLFVNCASNALVQPHNVDRFDKDTLLSQNTVDKFV